MPTFNVVLQQHSRYQVVAKDGDAAVARIKSAHFLGDLREHEHQLVDRFTKCENTGEVKVRRKKCVLTPDVLQKLALIFRFEAPQIERTWQLHSEDERLQLLELVRDWETWQK